MTRGHQSPTVGIFEPEVFVDIPGRRGTIGDRRSAGRRRRVAIGWRFAAGGRSAAVPGNWKAGEIVPLHCRDVSARCRRQDRARRCLPPPAHVPRRPDHHRDGTASRGSAGSARRRFPHGGAKRVAQSKYLDPAAPDLEGVVCFRTHPRSPAACGRPNWRRWVDGFQERPERATFDSAATAAGLYRSGKLVTLASLVESNRHADEGRWRLPRCRSVLKIGMGIRPIPP